MKSARPGHLQIGTSGGRLARRVHATLLSALTSARKARLISANPARDVELPRITRPRVHPWEPEELGCFLDAVAGDPFGPLYEVIAATGMRRGETLGLRWDDVDIERGVIVVRRQLVQVANTTPCVDCGRVHRSAAFGPPKTRSGDARTIELDGGVLGVLMAHRLAQDAERAELGDFYSDHGLVFARSAAEIVRPSDKPRWTPGEPIAPDVVTKRFTELVNAAGLRPIPLHDLRHGQASLLLAAGVPMAVVSKRLGHSSLAITSDTYSHLLEGVGREAAELAAALVPRKARMG